MKECSERLAIQQNHWQLAVYDALLHDASPEMLGVIDIFESTAHEGVVSWAQAANNLTKFVDLIVKERNGERV